MNTCNYLFVYGTLLDKENEYASYLSANCSFCCEASFKGLLFDIGEYPGAFYDPDADGFVYGKLFSINTPETILKVLDDYEGFGDDYPKPNEFIREIKEVETITGAIQCWVYLYNLPVDGFKQILSGKYIA